VVTDACQETFALKFEIEIVWLRLPSAISENKTLKSVAASHFLGGDKVAIVASRVSAIGAGHVLELLDLIRTFWYLISKMI
jgi:hypothetical protein